MMNFKILILITGLFFLPKISSAQINTPVLVGYWHNWNDVNAPFLPLNSIDSRYDVIEVSFAIPTSTTDMTMLFVPDGISQANFIAQVQTMQSQGKKVLISIGGATASIDLSSMQNKNAFINSITAIIDTFGFDGIDIDIESGNSILIAGGSITAPGSVAQQHLIEAIQQIMLNHRNTHQEKLLLTMAPETAYVQGGQSAFGSIWGGYLPIIDALRDSLDLLQVQLYNSGTMFGIDGNIYTQGSADFIVAMTEAAIQGFNTMGGQFNGLPSNKIAVALPACSNAAGGGFTDSATVKSAMDYLLGNGPQPGTYPLLSAGGYPNLGGMMTWSINWDAVSNCENAYQFANNYQGIFGTLLKDNIAKENEEISFYPNPSQGEIQLMNVERNTRLSIFDLSGKLIYEEILDEHSNIFKLSEPGIYVARIQGEKGVKVERLVVLK